MNDQYEADKQWLLDNGFTTINAGEFSDRVTRDMEAKNAYDCVQVSRDKVVCEMLMEQ